MIELMPWYDKAWALACFQIFSHKNKDIKCSIFSGFIVNYFLRLLALMTTQKLINDHLFPK